MRDIDDQKVKIALTEFLEKMAENSSTHKKTDKNLSMIIRHRSLVTFQKTSYKKYAQNQ